jgi:hypothetical protein
MAGRHRRVAASPGFRRKRLLDTTTRSGFSVQQAAPGPDGPPPTAHTREKQWIFPTQAASWVRG